MLNKLLMSLLIKNLDIAFICLNFLLMCSLGSIVSPKKKRNRNETKAFIT